MWHIDTEAESEYMFRPSWKQMRGWVATILLALMFVGATYAVMQATLTIPSEGQIETLGVECEEDTVDWETLILNTTTTRIIHVTVLNYPATLTIEPDPLSWDPPEASEHLEFSTDYVEGTELQPDVLTTIELYLYVNATAEDVITEFSFNIVITATSA